jgi:threonine dehydrogenase-like Zn-dependent dehydrogenase
MPWRRVGNAEMKAVSFRASGQPLELVDIAEPVAGDNEVILRVARCGISGLDLRMTEPGDHTPPCGTVLGHEISGEVVALGRGVQHLVAGDRVAATPTKGCGHCHFCLAGVSSACLQPPLYSGGGFAEYACVSASEAVLLPHSLSFSDGALVEPLAVALHGTRMVDVRDAYIRVIGAGPIGLAVVFWARRLGAGRIDVLEPTFERQVLAQSLGANWAGMPIPTPHDALSSQSVHAPEIVFECVGRPGLLLNAVSQVRPRGTVVSLGACMHAEPFPALAAIRREITMKFSALYSRQDLADAILALESVHFGPRAMLSTTVSLSELPRSFEKLRSPTWHCKVMVDPRMSNPTVDLTTHSERQSA